MKSQTQPRNRAGKKKSQRDLGFPRQYTLKTSESKHIQTAWQKVRIANKDFATTDRQTGT